METKKYVRMRLENSELFEIPKELIQKCVMNTFATLNDF